MATADKSWLVTYSISNFGCLETRLFYNAVTHYHPAIWLAERRREKPRSDTVVHYAMEIDSTTASRLAQD